MRAPTSAGSGFSADLTFARACLVRLMKKVNVGDILRDADARRLEAGLRGGPPGRCVGFGSDRGPSGDGSGAGERQGTGDHVADALRGVIDR